MDEFRFDINDPEWKGFLFENGFAIIKSVTTADESADYLSQMWGLMEELSCGRLSRDDMNSRSKGSNYPYMMHGGMIQYMGHSQLQWDLRGAAAPVFAKLYDTSVDDLSSSFDGLCFMDGARKYRKRPATSFLHADQSPRKNYLYSIQGLVNLVDSGPDDGGFVCVPGSHNYTEFWDEREKTAPDWYLFTDEEKTSDPMFDEWIKPTVAAGDMILWDSRTWHCNTVPTVTSIRAAVYVCMLPKKYISDKTKIDRAAAVLDNRVSTHHPGHGFKKFPKKPRWCGDAEYHKSIEICGRTVMTPLQKTLADM